MQISSSIQAAIQQKLSGHFTNVRSISFNAIGGGSINNTYRISFGNETVFCKINSASKFPHLFQREKAGLEFIAKQDIIKTPLVLACFEEEAHQILLLEWIQSGECTDKFWVMFGEQLAALHRITNESFGFSEDNYMGSVPQQNTQHESWSDFFAAERLAPMVNRCAAKNLLNENHVLRFDAMQRKLAGIFDEEKPSLLHGDLWGGNFMCDASSEPVLIDPAVYFGHRSADLAMTTLFGGFRRPFYDAYHYHFSFPKNYEEQWAVCNLYPLLIHLYLFGPGYLPQIEETLKRFE